MPLLDALRALTRFTPPKALPDCDPVLLADVLDAHGLAPMASYLLETTRLGADAPAGLRERLLAGYQGIANDNVLKFVTLRGLLKEAGDVPVVLVDALAYVDWIYPHLAFRPAGDLRLALRGEDGERFAKAIAGGMSLLRTEHGGRVAVFGDGRLEVTVQEGLWPGGPEDAPLYARKTPVRAFGPGAHRPSREDAVLLTVGDQALEGLHAPLITYVDLRELLSGPLDAEYLRRRAAETGLARALYGASVLVAWYWPEVADAAAAVRPALGAVERAAVEQVVEGARDPAKLRRL
ncbi:MAG TPA: nucleotidyltransferase family protein, partial [Anaeromyxobacteraceae bacterium]|nr:nucleotidyltransferase family protein [Anaeromyxobacteraceae bacterium]